jgi:hypothetical protein
MGQPPQEVLSVTIDETGTAHVTHNVKGLSLSPIQVDLLDGNMTNLSVTDANGTSVEYSSLQKSPLSIILNTSQRNMTLIKYDLVNAVTNTDGVWRWSYYEPLDTDFTAFHFPSGVDMVWANDRPVYLGERGLGQHGNGFRLQYVINEPVNIQNVQLDGKNFTVGVRTVSGLEGYAFDQSLKTYSFNVDKANVPITVIMPWELLGGPYDVTLNGNATLHQVIHNNGTHAWIGLEPTKSGTVQITGTTIGQVQQVANYTSSGSSNSSAISGNLPSGSSDNTLIYLLIGGIIAAGVAGIIIMKKVRSKTVSKP